MKILTVIIFIVAFLLYVFVGAFVANVVAFYKIRLHGKANPTLVGIWWCFWPIGLIIFVLYELISIPFTLLGMLNVSKVEKLIREKRLKI